MDFIQYWGIVERDHVIQNPCTAEKLMRLAEYCRLRDGLNVLDVGCGKGWLLRTWAKHWAINGVGLEINPGFVAQARELASVHGVESRIRVIEGPALDFRPQPQGSDVALCLGASFALGPLSDALAWLKRAIRADGVIAVGEPFRYDMPASAVQRAAQDPELRAIPSLEGTIATFHAAGLELIGLIASSTDDWDHYVSLQWRAAHEWAVANPAHPQREALLQRVLNERNSYLAWERTYVGWAIFVARPRPG